MVAALLGLALAATPVKLAAVPFETAGIDASLAALVHDTLANRLAERSDFQVTTPRDIAALLGLERQKQLLGCADSSSSCMAELGGALGVDALVTGPSAAPGRPFSSTSRCSTPLARRRCSSRRRTR